jgi:signal transduction histidine kinase
MRTTQLDRQIRFRTGTESGEPHQESRTRRTAPGKSLETDRPKARMGDKMQGIEQFRHTAVSEPPRVETIAETLAHLQADNHSLAALAHEARNMGTALGLYCELLEEPGVLAPGFQHYARELKTVAAAGRRIIEKLSLLQSPQPDAVCQGQPATRPSDFTRRVNPAAGPTTAEPANSGRSSAGRWALLPALPIRDLSDELRSNRNLLSALAGPSIQLTLDIRGSALPVRLTGEDLTRILVNLVKNSVEAMPSGGLVCVRLRAVESCMSTERRMELDVEDTGPGIPPALVETIFEAGFTTRSATGASHAEHRGVGLAVTRSIVELAGGKICAANRDPSGASFRIVLPVPEC